MRCAHLCQRVKRATQWQAIEQRTSNPPARIAGLVVHEAIHHLADHLVDHLGAQEFHAVAQGRGCAPGAALTRPGSLTISQNRSRDTPGRANDRAGTVLDVDHAITDVIGASTRKASGWRHHRMVVYRAGSTHGGGPLPRKRPGPLR